MTGIHDNIHEAVRWSGLSPPPSQSPARYVRGNESPQTARDDFLQYVPAELLPVANLASPRFSREICGPCSLSQAFQAKGRSKTNNKQSAVVSVACLKAV
jgi:hypothetical protein